MMVKIPKINKNLQYVVLALVAVVLVAGLWLALSNRPSSKNKPAATKTTTESKAAANAGLGSDYTGWTSYTLAHEKAAFKYPSDWSVANQMSTTAPSSEGDSVKLTAPDGFSMDISTVNLGHPTSDIPQAVIYSVPLTFLGHKAYLNYFGKAGTTTIKDAELSSNAITVYEHLFPTTNLNPKGNFHVSLSTPSNQTIDLNSIKTGADYKNAQLVLASMRY